MQDFILKHDNYALYDNYFGSSTSQAYLDCKMIATPGKYDFKPYAYGFQKDSPYLYLFNHFIQLMRERGTIEAIIAKYETNSQVCPDFSGKPLGISTCIGAFIVLSLGMLVCGSLFIIEHLAKSILDDNNILDNIVNHFNDSESVTKVDVSTQTPLHRGIWVAEKSL